jgi:hypothetical protein
MAGFEAEEKRIVGLGVQRALRWGGDEPRTPSECGAAERLPVILILARESFRRLSVVRGKECEGWIS